MGRWSRMAGPRALHQQPARKSTTCRRLRRRLVYARSLVSALSPPRRAALFHDGTVPRLDNATRGRLLLGHSPPGGVNLVLCLLVPARSAEQGLATEVLTVQTRKPSWRSTTGLCPLGSVMRVCPSRKSFLGKLTVMRATALRCASGLLRHSLPEDGRQ